MIRDGELASDCFVWKEGMADWQPANSVLPRLATKDQKDGLRALGLSVRRGLTVEDAESELAAVTSADPEKAALWNDWSARRQKKNQVIAFCASRNPPLPISTFFLEEVLEHSQIANPDSFFTTTPEEFVALLNETHPIHTWRDDLATEPQLRLLRSNDVAIHDGMTKGEAHDLIDALLNGPTEGQKRRLLYYGIDSIGVSKEQATELIDDYIAAHPDAEYGYQLWKAQYMRTHPPAGMNSDQWGEALDWMNDQSETMTVSLPDPIPGDERASPKQIVYIRSLVQHIDENKLQSLTKAQAISLIEQIRFQRKVFTKKKAEEYVATHQREPKLAGILIVIIVAIAVTLALAILSSQS